MISTDKWKYRQFMINRPRRIQVALKENDFSYSRLLQCKIPVFFYCLEESFFVLNDLYTRQGKMGVESSFFLFKTKVNKMISCLVY